MRDKIEVLQTQVKDLMKMFYEDTGMLPEINAESQLINLDGQQFVTNIVVKVR